MPTDNVRLARRWFEEVWNERREETARELLAADAVCQSEVGDLCGADGFLDLIYRPFLADFADFRVTIADGKFHGVMPAVTPTGSRVARIRLSAHGEGMIAPSRRLASSANHS